MTDITTADALANMRWSRENNHMVSIGLFDTDGAALKVYGKLRILAENAGIADARSMGMHHMGAQNALEGDKPIATQTYRYHLPLATFERMREANPEWFQTSMVSSAIGSTRAQ